MYVVIINESNECFMCTDMGAIASVTGISRNTVVNWFRDNQTHHKNNRITVYKDVTHIQSKRKGKGFKTPL